MEVNLPISVMAAKIKKAKEGRMDSASTNGEKRNARRDDSH